MLQTVEAQRAIFEGYDPEKQHPVVMRRRASGLFVPAEATVLESINHGIELRYRGRVTNDGQYRTIRFAEELRASLVIPSEFVPLGVIFEDGRYFRASHHDLSPMQNGKSSRLVSMRKPFYFEPAWASFDQA